MITRKSVGLYVALALAYFAPAFMPGRQIGGTDYFAGGYWFLEFAVRRIADGHIPKWVPYIYGGLPMYANPGGLFYPVRLLLGALLPTHYVMPALFVVQFATAGIGMHLLVRALGVRQWAAMVGGVAFELTGLTISYVFAGHDGRIIAATLAPLVFFFILEGTRTGRARWFVSLALAVGFVLLCAQIQSAYYLLIAGGAWAIFLLARMRQELPMRESARRMIFGLIAVAFGFAMAAVNLLPFSGYIADSPRGAGANRDFAFSTEFSMPPVETIGLAVPEQAGILARYTGENVFKLHTEYVGAVVLLLLVVGVVLSKRDPVWQFMAALSVFMLSISYGSNTPLYQLYYRFLPGTSKFRSPSIALFLVSMGLVVMAALTLERIAKSAEQGDVTASGRDRSVFELIRILTICVTVSLGGFVIAGGMAVNGSTRAIGWTRFSLFLYASAFVIRALLSGRMTLRIASIALVAVTAVDLLVVDRHFIYTEPSPDRAFAEDDVVRFLKSHTPGRVWVFPFPENPRAPHYMGNGRFGVRSDYLMRFGIAQAGGEHGNQLYRWNQLVGVGKSGNVDWHNFVAYPAIMEAASIRYIVSGVRLEMYDVTKKTGIPGIVQAHKGAAFVYVNNRALPRARLVPIARAVSPGAALDSMRKNGWDPQAIAYVEAPADPFVTTATPQPAGWTQIDLDDPDRVEVSLDASATALLALADNYADGWIASLDGREIPILRTNHAFRGVTVPKGKHKVTFEFKPKPLYAGLWISLGATIILVAGLAFSLRGRLRARNPDQPALQGRPVGRSRAA